MVISKEDQILIESLYKTIGYGMHKLLKQFPQKKLDERQYIEFD